MKTDLYFYSGTGNSLWAARKLAEELGDTAIHSISNISDEKAKPQGDAVGLVFPVHIWGVPGKIIRFLDILKPDNSKYYFAVAVNAGQVAATLLQLKKLMQTKGLTLSTGYDLLTPSNYIPWGGPGPGEKRIETLRSADLKIQRIASEIKQMKAFPIEKGPLWQNFLFSILYKMAFKHVPEMDKSFWSDDKCNSCGICEKVCPASNIELKDGRPLWLHKCEQCLACIQWCPKEAIQYGKKTIAYERYHNPEVKLAEIIASAPQDN